MQAPLAGALALRVFACFACGYLLSYALRSINAVIAPPLMADVGLSHADMGLLSSAYFVAFACMQLPLGIWLDRYGPRRTETVLLLIAAAGAIIFATSSSLANLWIGRALIGMGVSACLMAALKGFRLWFAPQQQSRLASLMLVAGTLGALSATIPVTLAMPLIGWRGVFWCMAALLVAVATALFCLLRPAEAAQQAHLASSPATELDAQDGYRQIFRQPYFRRVALLGVVNYGAFLALQTLWAGPWMRTVLQMSEARASQVLFAVNLCLLLSYSFQSWWAPRYVALGSARGWPVSRVAGIGLLGTLLTQAAMLMTTASWSWLLWLVLTACITVMTLIQTQVSLAFPARLAGRANGAYNLMLFVGASVMQWGIGALIDTFRAQGVSASTAIRMAFGICLACQAAALLSYALNRAQPEIIAK